MTTIEKTKTNIDLIKNNLGIIDPDTILYVNYPFCSSRCNYCLYYMGDYSKNKSKIFLEYLNKEINLYYKYLNRQKFKEIHIGRGTPSLISPKKLLEPLNKLADFNHIENFIMEIFPMPNLDEYLEKLKKYGITKINLGVQTLNQKILKNENRIIQTKIIMENLNILRESGLSWSVELIYGLNDYGAKRNYIMELKKILAFKPSSFHLYNIRSQKENNFYNKNSKKNSGIKYMDAFDFKQISSLLKENNYSLIGDEWCLGSDKKNVYYADKRGLLYDEPYVLGIGLWARSRSRKLKYRNTKNLNEYKKMLNDGLFPIAELFDYKKKYFLVANLLLSVSQSSSFDLKKLFSIPQVTNIEKKEVYDIIQWLQYKKIIIEKNGDNFIIPRPEYSRTIMLIEKYLKNKSGQNYFYKN